MSPAICPEREIHVEEIKREEKTMTPEEVRENIKRRAEEVKAKTKEATEAVGQGKGRLTLETPIMAGEEEVTELIYDFTALTGMEYAEAMDSGAGSGQAFQITYRQGLALFAAAVAKQMAQLDRKDIVERIGVTDAVEGVQLATLFFNASARAAFLRISKKS